MILKSIFPLARLFFSRPRPIHISSRRRICLFPRLMSRYTRDKDLIERIITSRRRDVTFTLRKGEGKFRGTSRFCSKKMLSFTFQLFFRCFFPLSSFFCRDSDHGTRRGRKREETKGREKKRKERKRQKVGTIQSVVRVSQSLN